MVAALSAAARLGILIKNVADIELAAKINAFVFDKTGTLTSGKLAVSRLAPQEGVTPAELLHIAAAFQVDVIEVIGHTDERPVSGGVSNLDRELPWVMSGGGAVGLLQPADNAGLGLARALAVVKVLSSDPRLHGFQVLPLSGAQLIGTDGRLTRGDGQGDVRERRRIEIRMRKSG